MSAFPRPHRRRSGFTLVELMVALTGGLFVSMVVFMLARDASRFYKSETRTADATLAGMVGFERLQNDISRAAFMASPNVRRDPSVCGGPLSPLGQQQPWPSELAHMAGLRIGSSPSNTTLNANNLQPDSIVLAGSFSSVDEFPIWGVTQGTGGYVVALQPNIGPLARMGYLSSNSQLQILTSIFGVGRALRIVDLSGKVQYGTITGVNAGAQPQVLLGGSPKLALRAGASSVCGIGANETGYVNVVNFVKYEVKSLKGNADYAPLYSDAGATPWDKDRTELVRSELDTSGQEIAGTEEVVAEYAVDLKFGLTVVSGTILNNTDPTLTTLVPGDPNIASYAGDTINITSPLFGPERIKAVRGRLSVRSREADRNANITAGGTIAPGLYRIGLGPGASAPFARVRTLQADVSLTNQMGVLW